MYIIKDYARDIVNPRKFQTIEAAEQFAVEQLINVDVVYLIYDEADTQCKSIIFDGEVWVCGFPQMEGGIYVKKTG
jgi:hypothetical protein